MSGADSRTRGWTGRCFEWVGPLVAASALATLFSVFVAQLLGAVAVAIWVADCWRSGRLVGRAPKSTWALLAFVLWTGVAVAASDAPAISAIYLKKHLKLLILPLATTYLSASVSRRWLRLFLTILGCSAVFGILQYAGLKEVDLLNRIDGFMSHWMTFSAQLMLGVGAVAALLLFERPQRAWRARAVWLFAGGIITAALLLTLTRSALLGAIGGVLLLVHLRLRWGGALAGIAVLIGLLALMPAVVQDRLATAFDLSDPTTQGRLSLIQTGVEMVAAHPLTGVGPRRIPVAAMHFRVEHEAPDTLYQHLHNNAVEIAASTGLPGLFFWLIWWGWLLYELSLQWRRATDPAQRVLASFALAAVVAFQLAGLFEYNFGDAEVVMLVLFVVAMPLSRSP